MKNIVNFILWPAMGGLVFALTLLLAPRLVGMVPGLAGHFSPASTASAISAAAPFSYSETIKKAAPAVVSINFQHRFTSVTRSELSFPTNNSQGSGVIISPDGFIITSYHVFFNEGTSDTLSPNISITLQDGRTIEGTIVRLDEKNDLALLKVFAEDLPYLRLADTSLLEVGNVVLAIGNPRNIGQSVTFGIISALSRREDSFMIQTDAAINPGNSGGALIDVAGNLIGINSTIVSESGGSEGISFSIPADKAIYLLDEYLASDPSGYLGVTTEVLTPENGRALLGRDIQGLMVKEVTANSPAEKAGLRADDIITGVNNVKLSSDYEDELQTFQAVYTSINSLAPGEQIVLEVFREGAFIEMPAILGVGEPRVYWNVEDVPEETNSSPSDP